MVLCLFYASRIVEPGPDEHDDVEEQTEDDSHVDGDVVVEAAGGEDVVEVDGVGQHEHAHCKAEMKLGYFMQVCSVYST